VAKEVKARWPECLIIFGGPQAPFHPAYYFVRHPFIDVTVRGEGEGAFRDILERWVESQNFGPIPGISWREPKTGHCIYSEAERPLPQDLDIYPSPYLSGLFDSLINEPGGWQYQAIIETNRGCPYRCTYCFWGQGGLSRKFRFHSLERIKAEIEWVARNRILYLFNADSNFGFHTRDYGIAQFLVQTKKKYGFPEKFRSCYAKNSSTNIYRIAKLLHGYQMEKGITLSLQSNCVEALKNVRRQNIKIESFKELQLRFNHENIPVYTELILGLPGESYQSMVEGIEEILTSGLRNQLFIYQCQVYPNSELADPEYQKRFGIITRRLTLNEVHGEIHPADSIREYEDIVIATYSMTVEQWRQMSLLSWVTMLLHSLKMGYFILFYLHHRFGLRFTDFLIYLSRGSREWPAGSIWQREIGLFEERLDRIMAGQGRGNEMPAYGTIYWDEEEAAFLRLSSELEEFYGEMNAMTARFLATRDMLYDPAELKEAILYQRLCMPSPRAVSLTEWRFTINFPEYFVSELSGFPVALKPEPQVMVINSQDYGGDLKRFAREKLLWGRKSGTILQEHGFTVDQPSSPDK